MNFEKSTLKKHTVSKLQSVVKPQHFFFEFDDEIKDVVTEYLTVKDWE